MSDLSDRLRRLAGRGQTRGAADVFAAAQADAASPAPAANVTPLFRQARVLTAIAATLVMVAGIAGALTVGNDNGKQITHRQAIGTTSTSAAATTPTTVSAATKVYLASTRLVRSTSAPRWRATPRRRR